MIAFILFIIVFVISCSYIILLEDYIDFRYGGISSFFKVLLIEQNFVPIVLLLLFLLLILPSFKKRFVRFLISLFPLFILSVLLVDNCLLQLLNTRFNFLMIGQTEGNTTGILDFIYQYTIESSGQLMIIGFVLSIAMAIYFICKTKVIISKKLLSSFSVITALSLVFYMVPLEGDTPSFEFFNPFQVNGFSNYKLGNFTKEYSDEYEYRKDLEIEWTTEEGLNQNRNVILLLVESWGCGGTEICSKGPSLTPRMDDIARSNLFFPNYYSIITSTSLSTRAIIHGVPFIQGAWDSEFVLKGDEKLKNERILKYSASLISKNNLIKSFKDNGYVTRYISATDMVYGMNDAILSLKSGFDEIFYSDSSIYKDIKTRYVFNSVSDGDLFNKIVELTQKEQNKYFYLVKTTSTHSPFNTPLASNDMRKAYEYTDISVADFIQNLEQKGFFKNGVVIIFGDHHSWNAEATNVSSEEVDKYGELFVNKVPLVIIDGKHKAEINNTEFSHASLGVMIQCMELSSCLHNQFNINPLSQEQKYETIFGYSYNKMSYLFVRKNGKEGTIRLDGDESEFIKSEFSEEEEKKNSRFCCHI